METSQVVPFGLLGPPGIISWPLVAEILVDLEFPGSFWEPDCGDLSGLEAPGHI